VRKSAHDLKLTVYFTVLSKTEVRSLHGWGQRFMFPSVYRYFGWVTGRKSGP